MTGKPRGMYKHRVNGNWYLQFYFNRKRYRWSSHTCVKAKAEDLMLSIRVAMRDGTFYEKYCGNPTAQLFILSEAVEWYLKTHIMETSNSKNIPVTRRTQLNMFIDVAGDKPASLYNMADIEKFKAKRLKDGISKPTINQELLAISGLFNVLTKYEKIKTNPISGRIIFYPDKAIRSRYASPDELKRIIEGIDDHELKMIALIALFTGMRPGNVVKLTISNIDFNNKVVIFNQIKVRKGTVKPNVVPISEMLLGILEQYIGKYNVTDKLFSFTNTKVSMEWKKQMNKLEIINLQFRDLRRTFATMLMNNSQEANITTVQKLLGHANSAITSQVYAQTEISTKRRAIEQGLGALKEIKNVVI